MSNILHIDGFRYNDQMGENAIVEREGNSMDLEKYIDRLDQDRRDMERRLTEERRLSEERQEKRSAELEERLERLFTGIDQRFDRMDAKLDGIAAEVRKDGRDSKRWLLGTFIAVASMAIATIAGIIAVVLMK